MQDKDEIQNSEVENEEIENEESFNLWKEILDWIKVIVIAFVIAFVLTHFIIVNAKVPTGSMNNTIATGSRIIGSRLSYMFSDPQRFDIIIFKAPDTPSENYVKRLIGLPGETVTIKDSVVTIEKTNGDVITLKEDYLKEEWVQANNGFTFNVPEDSYLMMGDNRNNSNDARFWKNTYVKRDTILGKVEFCYYPTLEWLGSQDYETTVVK